MPHDSMMRAVLALALVLVPVALPGQDQNRLTAASGALAVVEPRTYGGGWDAYAMLDDDRATGWASPQGDLGPHVLVLELPSREAAVAWAARIAKACRCAQELRVFQFDPQS